MVSVGTSKPVNDTQFNEVLSEGFEFTTTITLNSFDLAIKLEFYHRFEVKELGESIRFQPKRKHPYKSRVCINTCEKVGVAT
jgi:hypothetical protein